MKKILIEKMNYLIKLSECKNIKYEIEEVSGGFYVTLLYKGRYCCNVLILKEYDFTLSTLSTNKGDEIFTAIMAIKNVTENFEI